MTFGTPLTEMHPHIFRFDCVVVLWLCCGCVKKAIEENRHLSLRVIMLFALYFSDGSTTGIFGWLGCYDPTTKHSCSIHFTPGWQSCWIYKSLAKPRRSTVSMLCANKLSWKDNSKYNKITACHTVRICVALGLMHSISSFIFDNFFIQSGSIITIRL